MQGFLTFIHLLSFFFFFANVRMKVGVYEDKPIFVIGFVCNFAVMVRVGLANSLF